MELFDFKSGYRGDKLRLARMARGLSCEDLATALGKSKQYISKLEKGFKPSESLIDELAGYLDILPDFLFTERSYPIEDELCHFRSKKSRTKTLTNCILARAEILSSLISVLETEIEYPELNIPDVSDRPLNTLDDIERIAENCRRYWGLGLGPISSMVKFVENLGVIIAHVSDVDDRVDAFTVNSKRPIIIRNDAKPSICRFRSDIGHELGHIILHDGIVTGDNLTESQADQFSSAFLVPRVSFMKEFPKMRGRYLDWNALIEFKLRWKISLKMIIYRASTLGLLTKEQARSGYIHLNTKGHTKTEPGDDVIPVEEPSLLKRSIELLDDLSWHNILMKTGVTKELVRELFSVNKPISNKTSFIQLVN
ncbi:helix-turn-helix domain-containing protein [Xenorhabdus thailandensis]|uniref:helix-turn-helix domain-containing protein n=1 Tax=Xenorhabdus thailandensis TaxID=3136255 RepID=UPI0030F3D5BD